MKMKHGLPVCGNCEKPLSESERARFAITCDACTEKFLTEIQPNIGKERGKT